MPYPDACLVCGATEPRCSACEYERLRPVLEAAQAVADAYRAGDPLDTAVRLLEEELRESGGKTMKLTFGRTETRDGQSTTVIRLNGREIGAIRGRPDDELKGVMRYKVQLANPAPAPLGYFDNWLLSQAKQAVRKAFKEV